MKIKFNCIECGKEYFKTSWHIGKTKYCSRRCLGIHRFKNNPKLFGDLSHLNGNQFRKGKRPTNAFTSEQVSGENSLNWVESIKFNCIRCGKDFFKKPWEANNKQTTNEFCSFTCKCEFYKSNLSGENSPFYTGGETTYRGKNWLKARKLAIERDCGKCQDCHIYIGNSIPVHHIKPFREFSSDIEANHIDNLICYCQSCHMKHESRLKR